MANPLVLLHGYSDSGASYAAWRDALIAAGIPTETINICNYVTLNNEVTIDDIAEGFERGLQAINLSGQPFDAIVHSTGMLVLRSWLTAPGADAKRRGLLKHLIGLAPATFGSPLASKGRSLLGRIFKGNRTLGPDFLASGDRVLYNLELASPYTWNLAHRDLIGDVRGSLYGPDSDTPYVFVFDGTDDYGRLAEIFDAADQAGSDGTVRWSGCALNTRKITLDLSHAGDGRFQWSPWSGQAIPLIPIGGVNHGQILQNPPADLIALVLEALRIESDAAFQRFHDVTVPASPVVQAGQAVLAKEVWQQFVVRATDGRGNPITDYSLQILAIAPDNGERSLDGFEEDVHPYTGDQSFGCFHVRLKRVGLQPGERLVARIIASTGTELVGYQGFAHGQPVDAAPTFGPVDIDITAYDGTNSDHPGFFYPFTTTLIEIRLNREPIPQQDGTLAIFGWTQPT